MGDISEMRGLIVVGTFLGSLIFLVNLIPSQFLVSSYEGRTISVPEYFEAMELQSFVDTINITLDDSGGQVYIPVIMQYAYVYDFELGGHNLELWDHDYASPKHLHVNHYWYWWIFPTAHHQMEWLNKEGFSRGEHLDADELDNDYEETTIRYTIKCEHFQAYVFFGFNETTYSQPSDAWDNNELKLLFGIEFDQVNTSINAWGLIAMLLFFGLPNVHWIIDVLIHIPIWIAEAYLAFILILRTIGAIFGGGA